VAAQELFFCHDVIGEFVSDISCDGEILGKGNPYFPDGLGQSIAGPALFDPLRNLIREAIEGFLVHLLMNAFIRKNPDFPFEEGEKEENSCILLCSVKSSLKKSSLSPQPDCFLFSSDSNKGPFQHVHFDEEEPAGEKEDETQGNIEPEGGVEKKNGQNQRQKAREKDTAENLCLDVMIAMVDDHDDDFTNGPGFDFMGGGLQPLFFFCRKESFRFRMRSHHQSPEAPPPPKEPPPPLKPPPPPPPEKKPPVPGP